MDRPQLFELEAILKDESIKRHNLGGYSTDAETISLLTDVCLDLVTELITIKTDIAKLKRKGKK